MKQRIIRAARSAEQARVHTKRRLAVEMLEPRQLLAADTADCASPYETPVDQFAQVSDAHSLQTQAASIEAAVLLNLRANEAESSNVVLNTLPEHFSAAVNFAGVDWTLEFEKHSVFGENTRFLVDDSSGQLLEFDQPVDRSYLGTVAERPDYSVSALLTKGGLMANIIRPGETTLFIRPAFDSGDRSLHSISFSEQSDAHTHDHSEEEPELIEATTPQLAPSIASPDLMPSTSASEPVTPAAAGFGDSMATLSPSRVIQVREFEVGVEIGSAALLNNYPGSTTQQKVENAMLEAQNIPGNLDARYLHGAGIKHRLGVVIIRTGSDPFTVNNGNDSGGLSAFRSYWNNLQANEGKAATHDLAVYHVRANPSGLAYVNSVGTSYRYALSASNGPSSWADGTLVHEFGHSWSLGHVPSNPSNSYYESKPRDNNGSNTAGGSDVFVSVMHGGGSHNIGRLSTGEANQVYNVSLGKTQFGDPVTPVAVRPFGHRDSVVAADTPVTIDVVANDYDANNDILDAQLLDTVSQQGGTISLSVGTGPGGRNEIVYTPPVVTTGSDFFHYTVVDSTGKTDWGAVYIESAVINADPFATEYRYDMGPSGQIVRDGYVGLYPETSGDAYWTGAVGGIDRGAQNGIGEDGHDFITAIGPATFSHHVMNGVWRVTLNMTDTNMARDNMSISAEGGQVGFGDIDRDAGGFMTIGFDLSVADGVLDLTFSDLDGDEGWVVNRIVLQRKSTATDLAFQFDFGPNSAGAYQTTDAPAVLAAGNTHWNSVTRDTGDVDLVINAEGGASSVNLKIREANDGSPFNFAVGAAGLEDRTADYTGFHGTELMNDLVFTREFDDLGLQISDLPTGKYAVYTLLREPSAAGRTYSVDIGAGIGDTPSFGDFGLGNTTASPAEAPNEWTHRQNFYAETVEVFDGESLFVLIDSTNDQYVSLQGLQVVRIEDVELPENVYQIDIGPTTEGVHNGSNAPASLPSQYEIWNGYSVATHGDSLDAIVDGEGNPAPGVSVRLREAADGQPFDFNAPAVGLEQRDANYSGFYGSDLLSHLAFSRSHDDLGAEVRLELTPLTLAPVPVAGFL